MFRSSHRYAGLVAATLLIAACSGVEPTVSGPDSATLTEDLAFNGEGGAAILTLCKFGPLGTTATFNMTSDGGTFPHGSTVTLNAANLNDPAGCITAWQSTDAAATNTVTVTEVGMTAGTEIDRILVRGGLDGPLDLFAPANSASIRLSYTVGGIIYFKNIGTPPPPPPPPPGFAGCTPGYWKQTQHFDSWPAAYGPNMLFDAVFDDAFPGMTLLQVLEQGGGGIKALGRHTVAALLSSGALGLEVYGYTPQGVIDAFNAAFASGSYDALHNQLAAYNERGCPID